MGWFSRTFHKIAHKVKKFNWADLAEKGKRGWSVGTQILGYTRNAIPKLKRVAQIAALVPGLSEFAIPALAGLETADRVLSVADRGRRAIEKKYPSIVRTSHRGTRKPVSSNDKEIFNKFGTTHGVIPSVATGVTSGIFA